MRNTLIFPIIILLFCYANPARAKSCIEALSLVSGFTHPSLKHDTFGDLSRPRDWSAEDSETFGQAIREIDQKVSIPHFFSLVSQDGPLRVFRFGRNVEPDLRDIWSAEDPYYVDPENPYASVDIYEWSLRIFDRYFAELESMSSLVSYSPQAFNLFHELTHVVDGPRHVFSSDSTFLKLIGWHKEESTGEWHLKGVDKDEHLRIEKMVLELAERNKSSEAFRIAREYAHRFRLPSLHAMRNPAESLCDVAASIVFDPGAREYLSPQLIDWFKLKVLR